MYIRPFTMYQSQYSYSIAKNIQTMHTYTRPSEYVFPRRLNYSCTQHLHVPVLVFILCTYYKIQIHANIIQLTTQKLRFDLGTVAIHTHCSPQMTVHWQTRHCRKVMSIAIYVQFCIT